MRITPQQIQIQLAEIKANPKAALALKVGDLFQGKVLNVMTDAIVLQLNSGETLRADVAQLGRFVEGENLTFQVLDSSAETVQVELVDNTKVKVPTELIKQQLETVEIKPTQENIKAYEVLKSLDMNITKENIQTLSQNFKMLSVVHDKLEQVLPQLSQEASALPKGDEAPLKDGVTLPKENVLMSKQDLIVLSKALGFESETALKNADLKEVVVKMLNMVPQEKTAAPKIPLETLKEVFGMVRETLTNQLDLNDTMDKVGQLLKMSKPLTLKNFSVLDKLSFEGGKLGDQVENLIKDLDPKLTSPKLLSLLKGFDIKSFKNEAEVKVFFNNLMEELEVAKQSLPTRAKSGVDQLMSSISFLEKEQEEVSWIQLPIQMNQKTENLDLFFKRDKKEGKTLTKDNAKILIALNTEYLDTVQALVQVKGKTLDVGFNVQNEAVKDLFEANINALIKTLEPNFETVSIHVKNKKPMTYSEFVFEESTGHINMIV